MYLLQFDHRGIKDEAAREASHPIMGTPSAKKVSRPFQRLVLSQQEKNRRDKNLRSRLQKEKLLEQSRNDKRDELLNKAMRPRKQGISAQKQHRNKKSMSAFLHFMRPISSAFGAEIPHSSGVKKTAAELDFTPSGKPTLVLSLMDARVAQFINNERSFTFQLDTEDGGHYLLQSASKRDMIKWIDTISRVTKMAAKRRLTYLGSSPKPQLSDHIHNHPIVASRDPMAGEHHFVQCGLPDLTLLLSVWCRTGVLAPTRSWPSKCSTRLNSFCNRTVSIRNRISRVERSRHMCVAPFRSIRRY